MPVLPDKFILIYQELNNLSESCKISVCFEAATASVPEHLRVSLYHRGDFRTCVYIYPDAQDPKKCFAQTVPCLRKGQYTDDTANDPRNFVIQPPPADAAQVPLELKDLNDHITQVFELKEPFISRIRSELRELIKSSKITVTPTGEHKAVIQYEPLGSRYIAARNDPEQAGSLFVDLQPQASKGLGESTADSHIPWAMLSTFVKTRLIDPPAK